MSLDDLIDSHCHIVFPNFKDDIDEVAYRWREAGIVGLIHACVEPSEIPLIKDLADKFPEMRYSVGVHPLDTKHWQDETASILRIAAEEDSRVVAIGELGLDLFKDSNIAEQLSVLRPQLDLAVDLDLPVIIHCREASQPMLLELSRREKEGRCPRGVMHCWGGDVHEMQAFLDLGFYISFSGTVTFAKAKNIQECARQVPENKMLVETDCPFLAPTPFRGKRNEPAYVEAVACKVAELRGETFSDVARKTTLNARNLFGLS